MAVRSAGDSSDGLRRSQSVTPWLFVPVILSALVFLASRRRRFHKRTLSERTAEHQAALEMLGDWLYDERIQKALVTTGTVTLERMEKLNEAASGMTEAELMVLIATLTRDRRVRRVIADHLVRTLPGTTQFEAMSMLLALYEGGSGKLLERERSDELLEGAR